MLFVFPIEILGVILNSFSFQVDKSILHHIQVALDADNYLLDT